MCCCNCLYVEALINAANADSNRQLHDGSPSRLGHAGAQPAVAIAQAPKHLCGWNMLPLLRRRRQPTELEALAS
jgi:hypothetical protein